MIKKVTIRNIVASLVLQVITILSGFVLPKILLIGFGSEVNGLVSSLNQFLSYVTLLEGGLNGVIMSGLYKPLSENDEERVSRIIKAAEQFFTKIALIYCGYVIVLAVVYPLLVESSYSWPYIFVLTLILGSSLFIQYFFVLSYKLLLNADRQGAIVSIVQSIAVLLNVVLSIVVVKIYPSVHVLKLISVLVFCIQPIAYKMIVDKKYHLDKKVEPDKEALKQRWDGFGQNLAYFVHMNTDVVILTVFTSLTTVSVYSVYFMIAISLKNLVISISSAIEPTMGNVLAKGDRKISNEVYDAYEFLIGLIVTFVFTAGIALIVPFISVYTKGVEDANYIQPLFGAILMLAEAVYCYRDPAVCVSYAAGHFKQTAKYAYVEAALNVVLSVILVARYGLIGVAIGTSVSMVVRMICQVYYLKDNILIRQPWEWVKRFFVFMTSGAISLFFISKFVSSHVSNYVEWILLAVKVVLIVTVILSLFVLLFRRRDIKNAMTVVKKVF